MRFGFPGTKWRPFPATRAGGGDGMAQPRPEPLVFFLHLQKTGGWSVIEYALRLGSGVCGRVDMCGVSERDCLVVPLRSAPRKGWFRVCTYLTQPPAMQGRLSRCQTSLANLAYDPKPHPNPRASVYRQLGKSFNTHVQTGQHARPRAHHQGPKFLWESVIMDDEGGGW